MFFRFYIVQYTIENINTITQNFKIAYRPINPIKEFSNRSKNVYSRFLPYKKLETNTVITNPKELFKLGKFVEVAPTSLNHNQILNDLETNYNIVIPRKTKTK